MTFFLWKSKFDSIRLFLLGLKSFYAFCFYLSFPLSGRAFFIGVINRSPLQSKYNFRYSTCSNSVPYFPSSILNINSEIHKEKTSNIFKTLHILYGVNQEDSFSSQEKQKGLQQEIKNLEQRMEVLVDLMADDALASLYYFELSQIHGISLCCERFLANYVELLETIDILREKETEFSLTFQQQNNFKKDDEVLNNKIHVVYHPHEVPQALLHAIVEKTELVEESETQSLNNNILDNEIKNMDTIDNGDQKPNLSLDKSLVPIKFIRYNYNGRPMIVFVDQLKELVGWITIITEVKYLRMISLQEEGPDEDFDDFDEQLIADKLSSISSLEKKNIEGYFENSMIKAQGLSKISYEGAN